MTVLLKEGNNTLVIEGDYTIQFADTLRRLLTEALSHTSQLILDVSSVTAWDVPALQLLCSAHKSALYQGKHITFGGEMPDTMIRILKESGYIRHTGCNIDLNGECLWIPRRSEL